MILTDSSSRDSMDESKAFVCWHASTVVVALVVVALAVAMVAAAEVMLAEEDSTGEAIMGMFEMFGVTKTVGVTKMFGVIGDNFLTSREDVIFGVMGDNFLDSPPPP